MLKEAGSVIVPSLTKLLRLSLALSKVPNQLKKANVISIHKNESKSSISNYRPISLLPAASKILERVIFRKVVVVSSALMILL